MSISDPIIPGGQPVDDGAGVVDEDGSHSGKHFLEVFLEPRDVLRVADDLQEVLVAHEVEPGERRSLPIQVLGLLCAAEELQETKYFVLS